MFEKIKSIYRIQIDCFLPEQIAVDNSSSNRRVPKNMPLPETVNLLAAYKDIVAHWSPKILAQVNDQYVKIASLVLIAVSVIAVSCKKTGLMKRKRIALPILLWMNSTMQTNSLSNP